MKSAESTKNKQLIARGRQPLKTEPGTFPPLSAGYTELLENLKDRIRHA
jgi:hypothetical protein